MIVPCQASKQSVRCWPSNDRAREVDSHLRDPRGSLDSEDGQQEWGEETQQEEFARDDDIDEADVLVAKERFCRRGGWPGILTREMDVVVHGETTDAHVLDFPFAECGQSTRRRGRGGIVLSDGFVDLSVREGEELFGAHRPLGG